MKSQYATILIILAFIGFLTCNYFNKRINHIVTINGVETSTKPCIDATNELFGKAINSEKACECLLPKYYEALKSDSNKLNAFKQSGFIQFDDFQKDSLSSFYRNCLLENIIDTAIRINFSDSVKTKLKIKLRETVNFEAYLDSNKANDLYNCVIEKLNHLTVKQYLLDNEYESQKTQILLDSCLKLLTQTGKK